MLTRSKARANSMDKRRRLETNPLELGTVLERIFYFLDMDSLKLARQVKKRWNDEGAKSLISKYYLKIPSNLEVEDSSSSYSKAKEEFEAFLYHKKKDSSMIPNIVVRSPRDFALWKEFGVLGPQVRSLKLIDIADEAYWLYDLFNLRNLPDLKYLRVHKLNQTQDFYLVINALSLVMSKPKKQKKPLVVSRIVLQPQNLQEFEEIENLSNCSNILFEELKFFIDVNHMVDVGLQNLENRCANTLNKMILTSQNKLEVLTLIDCAPILPLLDFPRMTGLKKMVLDVWPLEDDTYPNCEFPRSFRFSEKFPNLRDFDVQGAGMGTESVTDFFVNLLENAGPAPSLKHLSYFELTIDHETMGPLFQVFPNIEELEEFSTDCTQRTFHSLWSHGQNLRKLYVNISVEMYERHNQDFGDLDAFFTGFSLDTLDSIKKLSKLPTYTLEELEELRVNPSILLLKELKELTIDFEGDFRPPMELPKNMLAVTGEFTFKFMPSDARIVILAKDCFSDFMDSFDQVSKLANVTVR